ncbi:MAG: TIGR02300 family protein [Holosporaceae bacterium]|jgi:uncharacterized protein (TIGR02300 family)|nr:TIGR02300 family protein [Holosporaceae bacterium]
MNKNKWGVKRVCLSCGVRFYDFGKSPIVCPSCGTIFDPEYLTKKKSKTSQEKDVEEEEVIIDEVDGALEGEDLEELDENDGAIPLDEEKN